MKEEIKARIAAINSGIVPEGYKKTKVGIVPEEWAVVRFQNITERTGKERNNSENNYPIYSINNKKGFSSQEDQFENSGYANTSKDLYRIVYQGEFAYNPARINVGSIGLLKDQEAVIISSLYVCFKMRNNCDLSFFEQYFKSHRFSFDVNNYTEGSVREYLFYDNFSKIHTILPPLPEQQKIAEILSIQDKLIELQEKKTEQLKELKKAYLQKMFPKKGSKYPEIRFKGFTDAWEQRKLSDIVGLFGGNAFSSSDSVENGVRWLKIANVGMGKIKWDEESFLPKSFLDDYSAYCLKIGDYVMALTRPILDKELKIAEITEDNILLNQRVAKLVFACDKKFGYQLLRKRSTVEMIENELAGTDPPNLSVNTLNNISIMLPCIDEQGKIGKFLAYIDNLITLHQRKLEQEKQKKKALMQLLLTGKVRVKI